MYRSQKGSKQGNLECIKLLDLFILIPNKLATFRPLLLEEDRQKSHEHIWAWDLRS